MDTRQRNAAIKAKAIRRWREERLANLTRRFNAMTGVKKLAKIEALAADDRGNANVRAVAAAKAKSIRTDVDAARQTQKAQPFKSASLPPLPSTAAEWDALKRKVAAERKAKRAAAK